MSHLPTLADVARKAGVAPKTVARVVTNEAFVSDALRERVEAAIAELGYRANISARSLASAQSYRVAVISPLISAYFISQLHQGASEACRQRGYQLAIHAIAPDGRAALDAFARILREQPLDGALIAAPLCDNHALLDFLDQQRVRYVRHSPLTEPGRSDSVVAQEDGAVAKLVDHLWSAGHRRFGIVSGPDNHLASHLRRNGALAAIAGLGGDPVAVTDWQMHMRTPLHAQGEEAAAAFLAQPERPTAILCYNDVVAAGVLARLHRAGVSIPGDMAVAGYGDADFAEFLFPALTTLHQPNAAMARTAIEWLTIPRIDEMRNYSFPVDLVIRESA